MSMCCGACKQLPCRCGAMQCINCHKQRLYDPKTKRWDETCSIYCENKLIAIERLHKSNGSCECCSGSFDNAHTIYYKKGKKWETDWCDCNPCHCLMDCGEGGCKGHKAPICSFDGCNDECYFDKTYNKYSNACSYRHLKQNNKLFK
jgi:hypothetical protein